jgi:thioredoxin 1
MTKAAAVTDATFDREVLQSNTPVLVDFWAEWCGPCKMVSPVLEEIAEEHKDKLTIAKLNVDENPEIAMRYGVMSIPTLALFVGGVEKKRLIGAMPKRNIVAELGEFIT